MTTATTRTNAGPSHCVARLFDVHAADRALSCDDLARVQPGDHQLLWVDLLDPSDAVLQQVWAALALPAGALTDLQCGETSPQIMKRDEHFWTRVVAVTAGDGLALKGRVLMLVAGRNTVVSIHAQAIHFLDELRERESSDSDIGVLGAESFVAALLDWHLASYFESVADFEMAVERLEVNILAQGKRDCLPELRRLRKAASRLRRMLAPHRRVFSALSRPDFRPTDSDTANAHFAALDTRFERAMDMVENARDLVVGSFELFSSRAALQTNDSMRVLTFVTVVSGALAVVAGVLGMNFDAAFFQSKSTGFWLAVAAMAAMGGGAVVLGKWRRWI